MLGDFCVEQRPRARRTVPSVFMIEEFRRIKPQMDGDAPKGIENADEEGSFWISVCVHLSPSAVKKS